LIDKIFSPSMAAPGPHSFFATDRISRHAAMKKVLIPE
jgi:hypothetical protein